MMLMKLINRAVMSDEITETVWQQVSGQIDKHTRCGFVLHPLLLASASIVHTLLAFSSGTPHPYILFPPAVMHHRPLTSADTR